MQYYIVEQTLDNLEIVWASQTDPSMRRKVAERIFPSGSNWGKYIGYRAFKFVELERSQYLLSYTIVIDDQKSQYYGLLRSWGIVSNARNFTSDFKTMTSLDDYYLKQKSKFQEDPLFSFMLKKLESQNTPSIKKGCLWPVTWVSLQLGIKTVFQFNSQYPQSAEKIVLLAFKATLWKTNFGSENLSSFATLSLSRSDPVKILAIPE